MTVWEGRLCAGLEQINHQTRRLTDMKDVPAPPPAPDRSGYLPVSQGTRQIYWEYFGHGDKEAVVILNGVAMSTRSWYHNVPELKPGYDILLYDYLGQGRSSQEDEPYSIEQFAEYLIGIMDKLQIERIHPVGISYGGFIAAELGRLFQDRLYTLTLSGILLTRETQFQMYQDLSLRFYRCPDPAFELYTHYIYEKILGEAFADRFYGDKLENMRQSFFDRYHGKEYCLIRLTEAQDPFFERIDRDPAAYRQIRTPTLILTGEQDRAIPPWQQAKLLNILPHARQILLPGSGHMTYMERPDLFWPALRAFFAAKSIDFAVG
jgi:pimeloyl-ACP methyl ester carboxylesterase